MSRFDIDSDLVRRLAGLIEETGLGEIEYQDGDRRIRVTRPAAATAANVPQAVAPAAAPAAPVEAEAAPQHSGSPITAPMVGTAYLQPEPTAPAFVSAGDHVAAGDTLMIIEAMKVMNPITAPRAGVVRQIMVENEAPVEYGEILMMIE